MAGPQSGPVPLFVFPRSALHTTAVSRGDGVVPAAVVVEVEDLYISNILHCHPTVGCMWLELCTVWRCCMHSSDDAVLSNNVHSLQCLNVLVHVESRVKFC